MTSLTPRGAANRLLPLTKQPKEPPRITGDPHALYRLFTGYDFVELEEGEDDYSQRTPIMTYRRRIQTEEAALRLQLTYHTLHQRFAMYTPYSQRLDLVNNHTHKDRLGNLCVYVRGLVTDYAVMPHTGISRICLISPTIVDNPRSLDTDTTPIDSHIWLRADRLDLTGDYTDPSDPDPRLHCEARTSGGDIRIGDLLTVAGRVNAYTDEHGRRRLGVGEWTPLSSTLLYEHSHKDGSITIRHVPRHLLKHMRILKITGSTKPLWADAHMLDREIIRWQRKYPQQASQMRISLDVDPATGKIVNKL